MFQVIPTRLTTNQSNINIVYYLLRQTHLPIFTESGTGQFESTILEKWSRSADNRHFVFCPNSQLKFTKTESLANQNIVDSLDKVKSELGLQFRMKIENGCTHVISKNALPNLSKALADYRYAPSIQCAKNWECGLGVFEVTEITQSKLSLRRKVKSKNKSEFQTITLAQPEALKGTGVINDINRTIEELPSWVNLSDYASFEVNLLQTLVLIINIPDINIRRALFNCIQPNELTIAFNPSLKITEMNNIETILPAEIYQLKTKNRRFECRRVQTSIKPLNFINWRTNNKTTLPDYITDIQSSTNIKLQSIDISPSDFVQALTTRNKEFNNFDLIPMAIGAEANDFTSFFRPLIAHNKSYLSYAIPKAAGLYNELIASVDRRKSLLLARRLADLIKNNFVAIPMYQVRRTFYYPSSIKNIDTGRNFLEYPEVSQLEIH